MERDSKEAGIELAWVGAPLRKHLAETATMPVPCEILRLLDGFAVGRTGES
jgi:hypothetical protein